MRWLLNLLEEQDIPADVLLPLIDETAAKIHTMPPRVAQTGPAIRYDENVINKHFGYVGGFRYAVDLPADQSKHT